LYIRNSSITDDVLDALHYKEVFSSLGDICSEMDLSITTDDVNIHLQRFYSYGENVSDTLMKINSQTN